MKRNQIFGILIAVILTGSVFTGCGNGTASGDSVSITNVSYDPTRELYSEYNAIFAEHWKEKTMVEVYGALSSSNSLIHPSSIKPAF